MKFPLKSILSVLILGLLFTSACSNQIAGAPLLVNPPYEILVTATSLPDGIVTPEPTAFVEPTATPEVKLCRTSVVRAIPEYNNKNLVNAFQTVDPFVVLTIDDGYSNSVLDQMLDILEANDTKATFFLVGTSFGEKIQADTLKRLVENGNDIAYHSYAHPEVSFIEAMSLEDWLQDYRLWSDALRGVIGEQLFDEGVVPYARAPYGAWTSAFMTSLAEQDLTPFYWNADEHTFEANRMPLREGSILILHIIPENLDELEQLMTTDWDVLSLREALGEECD